MSWQWYPSDEGTNPCFKEHRTNSTRLVLRNTAKSKPSAVSVPSEGNNEIHQRTSKSLSSSRLLNLPNETITHIFAFISNTQPSTLKSLSKPDYDLTHSNHQPLKQISLTNHRLRYLVRPVLFRHARVDPCHLSAFLAFTHTSDLAQRITSVTVQLQGPQNHVHPPWWTRLLQDLPNLNSLTVLAAPHVFAEIGQVPIETSYSWAFKIPYQSITLGVGRNGLACYSDSLDECDSSCEDSNSISRYNLLTARPWANLMVNESSHLPAYSTYEYFLKVPPSLITSLYQRHKFETQVPPPQPYGSPSALLSNLLCFSYVAIFPFYNHVDEVLKCVRQMKRLRRLFVKLCPEPESTVLRDELERNSAGAGRTEGRIDVNDPWNEFETSYTLIPHTIIYLTTDGSLEEFQTDDVKMIGIRDSLVEDINRRLDGLGCWSHVRDGTWVRKRPSQPSPMSDTTQGEEVRDDPPGDVIETI